LVPVHTKLFHVPVKVSLAAEAGAEAVRFKGWFAKYRSVICPLVERTQHIPALPLLSHL